MPVGFLRVLSDISFWGMGNVRGVALNLGMLRSTSTKTFIPLGHIFLNFSFLDLPALSQPTIYLKIAQYLECFLSCVHCLANEICIHQRHHKNQWE